MNITIGITGDQEAIWVNPTHKTVHFGKYTMSMEYWRDINERVIAANQPQLDDGPLTPHFINQANQSK